MRPRPSEKSLPGTFERGTRIHLHFTKPLIELFVILSWRFEARTRAVLSSPVARSRAAGPRHRDESRKMIDPVPRGGEKLATV